MAREAWFCHPWQNITEDRQAYKDFLIFFPSHKSSSGFVHFDSLEVLNHRLPPEFCKKHSAWNRTALVMRDAGKNVE